VEILGMFLNEAEILIDEHVPNSEFVPDFQSGVFHFSNFVNYLEVIRSLKTRYRPEINTHGSLNVIFFALHSDVKNIPKCHRKYSTTYLS
jgi:hypothetical protein